VSFVGRIFMILFGCIAASLAAGTVIAMAAIFPAWSALHLGDFDNGAFRMVFGFGVLFLSGFAVLPMLLLILVAESFAFRSAVFYAAGGALVAALVYLHLQQWEMLALAVNGFARRDLEISAAAGIVGGFVYWAIAGRRAGLWGAAAAR
jgi:hypothetical protein